MYKVHCMNNANSDLAVKKNKTHSLRKQHKILPFSVKIYMRNMFAQNIYTLTFDTALCTTLWKSLFLFLLQFTSKCDRKSVPLHKRSSAKNYHKEMNGTTYNYSRYGILNMY